jgi:hypothetical protein
MLILKERYIKALICDLDGGIQAADKAKDLYEAQSKMDKY